METDMFWVFLPDRGQWEPASKEEYVRVERACGFRNTLGQPDEPATSWFCGRDGTRGHMGFLHDVRDHDDDQSA